MTFSCLTVNSDCKQITLLANILHSSRQVDTNTLNICSVLDSWSE